MEKKKGKKSSSLAVVISLIVGFINGFFGGGGGLIVVPTLEKLYKLKTKNAHATAIAVMLPLSIISSCIYLFNNTFNISSTAIITAGVILGGFLGAVLLKKFKSEFIGWTFIAIMFIAGVKMVV